MANSTSALPPLTGKQHDDLLQAGVLAEYMNPQYHHLKMAEVVDRLLDGNHNLTEIFGDAFAPYNPNMVLELLKLYLPTWPHDYSASRHNLVLYYICGGAAIVVVAARFYSRACITKAIRPEDWFTLVSLAFTIAFNVACLASTAVGFVDSHLYDISYNNLVTNLEWIYICEILYLLAITAVRFQVLIFYRGLSPTRMFQRIVMCLTVLNTLLFVSGLATVIFQCKPVAWWLVPLTAKCIDRVRAWEAWAAIGMAFDLVMFAVPMPVIWSLKLNKREKVFVCAIMALGLMVWIGTINRFRTMKQFITSVDITYYESRQGLWSMLEIDLALIASSVPALKALVVKHFPSLIGRTKQPSVPHGGDNASPRRQSNGGAGDTGRAGSWRSLRIKQETCLKTDATVCIGVSVTVNDLEAGSEKNPTTPDVARYNPWQREVLPDS